MASESFDVDSVIRYSELCASRRMNLCVGRWHEPRGDMTQRLDT